jgi:hypothetical protein
MVHLLLHEFASLHAWRFSLRCVFVGAFQGFFIGHCVPPPRPDVCALTRLPANRNEDAVDKRQDGNSDALSGLQHALQW